MSGHPLDRPIWHALTTRQRAFAAGDEHAVRIAADVGVFGAAADGTPGSAAAFARLIAGAGETWTVECEPLPPPPGTRQVSRAPCVQMIAATLTADPSVRDEPIVLDEDDAAEMLALATLTRPGPFLAHTHRLGRFVGVRREGRLVAMAGERLRPPGFTEVSGVCTHPDHRGQGYAARLMRAVASAIVARGETPFLTAYASNEGAVALYRQLGFVERTIVQATVLAPDI